MNEYELYHHGIKGQKWGVRRTAAQLGHFAARKIAESAKSGGKLAVKLPKAAVAKAKKDYKEQQQRNYYKKLKKKSISNLTDKELSDLTERVKKEAALKDVNYESRVQNARKFYKNVAQKPLETVITVYAKEKVKNMFGDTKSDDNDNKK